MRKIQFWNYSTWRAHPTASRDDDNIYLDGVKNGLQEVMNEASERLKQNAMNKEHKTIVEHELAKGIPELHSPAINSEDREFQGENIKFRQLTGQPAGKGIAKGVARVINKFEDLFSFQKDEILGLRRG